MPLPGRKRNRGFDYKVVSARKSGKNHGGWAGFRDLREAATCQLARAEGELMAQPLFHQLLW